MWNIIADKPIFKMTPGSTKLEVFENACGTHTETELKTHVGTKPKVPYSEVYETLWGTHPSTNILFQ